MQIRKGKWILNLCRRCLDKSISPQEALQFFQCRLGGSRTPFTLEGVKFIDVDHVLWSIAAQVFVNREYSPKGFDIREGDLVVDIGAHMGVFTAFAAKRTTNRVIAFEPEASNFAYLSKLMQQNHFKHVKLVRSALASKTGKIRLFLADRSSRHSTTGRDAGIGSALETSLMVPSLNLDDALVDYEHIDLLKMDCEGAELEILRGASTSTLRKVKRLAMEYHAPDTDEYLDDLLSLLSRHFSTIKTTEHVQENLGMIFAAE